MSVGLWISISEACQILGYGSPDHWRRIEADRKRKPAERRYSAATLAKFPPAQLIGGRWMIFRAVLGKHVNARTQPPHDRRANG